MLLSPVLDPERFAKRQTLDGLGHGTSTRSSFRDGATRCIHSEKALYYALFSIYISIYIYIY